MLLIELDNSRYTEAGPGERLIHLADDLRTSLSEGAPVRLDLAGVANPDIRIVQMVEAARLDVAASGADFALVEPADAGFLALLDRAGFTPDQQAFWLQGTASR